MLSLAPATLVAALALAPSLAAQGLRSTVVLDGVPGITSISAPDGDDRIFLTHEGLGVLIVRGGAVEAVPFLDLTSEVGASRGLLDLAFHPDYASNGYFYVVYHDERLTNYLLRYQVSSWDPNLADPASRVNILPPVSQPTDQHYWSSIEFGPDGMLYVGTGDGLEPGAAGSNASIDLGSLSGKILRIDVDGQPPYVPVDNPFIHISGASRYIYHYGLRVPWRIAFDAAGGLFIGDVGESQREEVSRAEPGEAGLHFGWRCEEGTLCQNWSECSPQCDSIEWRAPILEYPHNEGRCAVIGGLVYQGSNLPDWSGIYFYGDFCSGRVWAMRSSGQVVEANVEITADVTPDDGTDLSLLTTFGTDGAGELLFYERGNGGRLLRIEPEREAVIVCEGAPNSVGPGATLGQTGSLGISDASFTLQSASAPPDQFGIFFYGPTPQDLSFGDGTLCVGSGATGHLRLYPPLAITASGTVSRFLDFTTSPAGPGFVGAIDPGSTWYFQFWYRDPMAGGSGFNLSEGMRVTFGT